MTKDEALNLAFAWYGSGNQDPDEFEKLIKAIAAQRTWVGLTKEERHEISMANRPYCANIMAAHEEELKRRNT
jgi:hypothetical protein